MNIPPDVQRHLNALGIGDAGIATIEREMAKAMVLSRDELQKQIVIKNDAIRLLRIQQAIYLAVLEGLS